jgi:hypothetical protein
VITVHFRPILFSTPVNGLKMRLIFDLKGYLT